MSINDKIVIASKGLADHIVINCKIPSIAIGFDSENSFDRYAPTAAGVFAANGVKVYLFRSAVTADEISEKIRQDNLSAGLFIMTENDEKGVSFNIKGIDETMIIYPDLADTVRIGDYKSGVQAGCIVLV